MPRLVAASSAVFLCMSMVLLSAFFIDRPGILLSSDTLPPAEFVWDALHVPQGWLDFQLSRVPSIFPDILIFGLVQASAGSWRLAMGVWIVAIIAGFALAGGGIVARMAPCRASTALLCLMPLLCLVLIGAATGFPRLSADADSAGYLFPYLFILLPNTHGGQFVACLVAGLVAERATRRSRPLLVILFCLLTSAAVLSDLLSVLGLVVPLTVALVLAIRLRAAAVRPTAALLAAAWCAAGLGIAAAQILPKSPTPYPPLAAIPGHVSLFLTELVRKPGMICVIVLFVLLVVADIRTRGIRDWLGRFWSVVAAVAGIGSLVPIAMLYEEVWSYRYMMPLLWWTLILAAAALARRADRFPGLALAPTVGMTIALAWSFLLRGMHIPDLLTWQAPVAMCLQKAGLHAGLADYWSARITNASSDWRLQVVQIGPTGAADIWVNDPAWFTHDIHDWKRPPAYRFIIMDGLPADQIAAAYGRASRALVCGQSTVWIYDDSDLIYHSLVRATPAALGVFAESGGR